MPNFPSTPQAFRFGTKDLFGFVTDYQDATQYRWAEHSFLKRDGGRQEPMGRRTRHLSVTLVFIGPNCAKDYQATIAYFDQHRQELLIHPVAGRYYAACQGPAMRIAFSAGTNRIDCPVQFAESQLDAKIPTDTPDVSTAAQNASGQLTKFQQTVATFLGYIAKIQATTQAALNTIDAALAQVTAVSNAVTSVVGTMVGVINQALGAASTIAGILGQIQAASDDLANDVTNFIATASVIFDGTSDSVPPATSDSIINQLGTVIADAQALEAALLAAPSTPAGAADAYIDVELMVEACMVLQDAVQAALPPTTTIIVPATMNLLALAQKLVNDFQLSYDAYSYASAILGLNRIENPAAVKTGTQLIVPTG